jgi:hypothetical protein
MVRELLMLMLSPFFHVHVVSALVPEPRRRPELQLAAGHGRLILLMHKTHGGILLIT